MPDVGARPWLARTQLNYGEMLLRRTSTSSAQPGDRERAHGLLIEALATAQELGMAKVRSDAERLLGEAEVQMRSTPGS